MKLSTEKKTISLNNFLLFHDYKCRQMSCCFLDSIATFVSLFRQLIIIFRQPGWFMLNEKKSTAVIFVVRLDGGY